VVCENYSFEDTVTVNGFMKQFYEGWNFNSGNYLFTTDTK